MDTLLVVAAVIDVAALGALGCLVWQQGGARELALSVQRATLEALRTDLAELVAQAERGGHALDATLGAHEARLRTLLAQVVRVAPVEGGRSEPAPTRLDPAEARLLRDLELRVGARDV